MKQKAANFLLGDFPDMLHKVILERFPDWGFVTPAKNVVRNVKHPPKDARRLPLEFKRNAVSRSYYREERKIMTPANAARLRCIMQG